MVSPDPEQLALEVHLNVVGVGVRHPTHDQPRADLPGRPREANAANGISATSASLMLS